MEIRRALKRDVNMLMDFSGDFSGDFPVHEEYFLVLRIQGTFGIVVLCSL